MNGIILPARLLALSLQGQIRLRADAAKLVAEIAAAKNDYFPAVTYSFK